MIPACGASAVLFFSIARWRLAAGHLLILFLLATLLAELCLGTVQKIPFACSYLPGKSNVHVTFWRCIGFIVALIRKGAAFERRSLEEPSRFVLLIAAIATAAVLARLRTSSSVRQNLGAVQFEDQDNDAVIILGLEEADSASGRS